MASNSYFCRNAQQTSARLNQSKEVLVEITPIPSTTSTLSQVQALALAPTLYTQKDL